MKIITAKNYDELSVVAADIIAKQIHQKPTSVLGLATGSTPIGTYEKLREMYKQNKLDFSHVTTFNLDEYVGLSGTNPQSYNYFMMEHLFSHVNIPHKNINIPNGTTKDIEKECTEYEQRIAATGGIDLQLLGIGHNGHIGFNEPDTVFHNKTRSVDLSESSIKANSRFFRDQSEVPTLAITMGIESIMKARKIVLIAGPDKANIIDQLKKPVVSPQLPASILHYHPDCTIIVAEN